VYLSIPYDDWDQPSAPGVEHLIERDVQTAGTPDARQLQVLVQQVQDARNPVLVLGPDVDATLSNDHAVALADKLRMPVWIAPSASRCRSLPVTPASGACCQRLSLASARPCKAMT
jgi:benzoylformate decarboxylase